MQIRVQDEYEQLCKSILEKIDISGIDDNILILIGDDKFFLKELSSISSDTTVLLVGVHEGVFLSNILLEKLSLAVYLIRKGKYLVEDYLRICSIVDGRKTIPALNDIVIVPSRSATLMSYTLKIDGEEIWRDRSDGVIVSTPIGSTAYNLSAGGPILHKNAKALVITSLNSIKMRRSVVVDVNSRIEIENIQSSYSPEIIIDGHTRISVYTNKVSIEIADPIKIIKIMNMKIEEKLRKKDISDVIQTLPPSAKFVYSVLKSKRELTLKELVNETGLPERTVRHALKILFNKKLIGKKKNLRDIRQDLYFLVL